VSVENTLPNIIKAKGFKALRRKMLVNNTRLGMSFVKYSIVKLQDGSYEAYYDEPIWKELEEITKQEK